jgi:hypothetical protein
MKIQKCEICGEETKALQFHMKKHNTAKVEGKILGAEIKNESVVFNGNLEPDPRYATKEDVNRINSSLEKLTELLTEKKVESAFAIQQPTSKVQVESKNPEQPDQSPVPPKWRAMVDEVLGVDFGINVVYPDSGNGFLFKIIVPAEKSNADKSYIEYYKTDIRTKSLSYSDGIDGVKRFCELVKRNLQKNNSKPL